MIARPELVERVTAGLEHSPVTLLLGPRQCGKTTLARQLGQNQEGVYYDLESPRDLARLAQPQTARIPMMRMTTSNSMSVKAPEALAAARRTPLPL